jgi:hypothetical protein
MIHGPSQNVLLTKVCCCTFGSWGRAVTSARGAARNHLSSGGCSLFGRLAAREGCRDVEAQTDSLRLAPAPSPPVPKAVRYRRNEAT